jgi:hypothetical protein
MLNLLEEDDLSASVAATQANGEVPGEIANIKP